MADDKSPECIECKSTEVVVHKHDITAIGDPVRTYRASYECVECGRQWDPVTELTGQSLKPITRYP
jgi:transposase-like protein